MHFRPHMPKAAVFAAVAIGLWGSVAFAAERDSVDVFVEGRLADGITLENGRVEGDVIVTSTIGVTFNEPAFVIKGLDVDISKVNLAQIHMHLVAVGTRDEKPNYAEVRVETSDGPPIVIPWFPFRSYAVDDPNYMTKSCEHAETYATKPEGKNYGRITGFRINVSAQGGMVMRFSKMQILIDKTIGDRYPDDPQPNPDWKNGTIQAVYAIPGSERVFLNELESPLESGNTVWRDGKVILSGARNEIVPFQVVIEAAPGADGLNDVDVRFAGVKKGDAAIDNSKAAEPDNPYNYVGRHVQLYRSRYILYDRIDTMEENAPWLALFVGKYIPEMQIPFEAKWGGAPFSIFPGQTQSVWIDTYIPKEAEAGLYKGNVEILVAGEVVKTLPVELTVHDFALPNKPSVHSLMFGTVHAKHRLEGDALREMEKTYRRFFRRHYTEMFHGVSRSELDDEKAWALRSGDLFTPENGYEGAGSGLPAPIIFITMYGGGLKPFGGPGKSGDEASWHAGLLEYKTMIDKYAPGAMMIYYAWDEPGHAFLGGIEAFKSWMNTVAPWVHSFNEKYGANVKVFVTVNRNVARDIPDLDIYAAGTRAEAEEMEREGDINCRWNGPQNLAGYASGLRVCGWKAFEVHAKIWWMWHFSKCSPGLDVYRDPYNFFNQYGEVGAGTGLFVYPGTDGYVTKRSPGLAGPVPGIRFFNWRQGFIDYEYLALAAAKDPKAVDEIVAPIAAGARLNSGLPGEMASVGYPIGDAPYAAAREKLVKIILGKAGE